MLLHHISVNNDPSADTVAFTSFSDDSKFKTRYVWYCYGEKHRITGPASIKQYSNGGKRQKFYTNDSHYRTLDEQMFNDLEDTWFLDGREHSYGDVPSQTTKRGHECFYSWHDRGYLRLLDNKPDYVDVNNLTNTEEHSWGTDPGGSDGGRGTSRSITYRRNPDGTLTRIRSWGDANYDHEDENYD